MAGKNTIDSRTGSITYTGSSEVTKGNHNNMPARTDAYLNTDERGHIQASSLSGNNRPDNVVPQSADLNHGGYYSMEQGERTALKTGTIESEKTAYVSNQPGNRPDAFIVNDYVTYSDGQTQAIHLSFSNLTNAEQEGMNAESSNQAADMFDALPNPGDTLRDTMSTAEYTALMEETDAILPNISDMYTEHVEVGTQGETTSAWSYESTAETDTGATEPCEFDSFVECENDSESTAESASTDLDGGDDGASISSDDD